MLHDVTYALALTQPPFLYTVLGVDAAVVAVLALRLRARTGRMPGTLVVLLLFVGFAASLVWRTSVDNLSDYSCLGGFFGLFVLPVIAAVHLGWLVWRRFTADTGGMTALLVLALVAVYPVVFAAAVRSLSHCTV